MIYPLKRLLKLIIYYVFHRKVNRQIDNEL